MTGCSGGSRETFGDGPEGVSLVRSALSRDTSPAQTDIVRLGADNRAFAFDLLHSIAAKHAGENLLFSPHSISVALALAYEGARSTTATEIASTLHFTLERPALHEAFNAMDLELGSRNGGLQGADELAFKLHANNALWAARELTVQEAYLDVLGANYGLGVFRANFRGDPEGSRKAINSWVSDQTDQVIKELLPAGSIRPTTPLVLTNAVYFQSAWKTPFEASDTHPSTFTRLDGSEVEVAMMGAGLNLPYAEGPGYQAVALPYASEQLSFLAILPGEGEFATVEAGMDSAFFDGVLAQLSVVNVGLGVPKLDYTARSSLKEHLRELGMVAAFNAADFSGISDASLSISDVLHQATIKVFEGGTIAAAATAVVFRDASISLPQASVVLDRPFMFAILDKPTGCLLFLGRVLDPSAM